MDTSNTSQSSVNAADFLVEVERKLRKNFKDLPFKRLGDYLGVFEKMLDRRYHFSYGRTIGSLNQSLDDMVFVIPIIETPTTYRNGSLKRLEVVQLVLERRLCGGEHGCWNIHRAKFVQVYPDTIPTEFNSSSSSITSCHSPHEFKVELVRIKLPPNFTEMVNSAICKWIENSIEKRRQTNQSLGKLKGEFSTKK
ncbi:MAG: hypothetical protein WCO12_00795 [bacterium]